MHSLSSLIHTSSKAWHTARGLFRGHAPGQLIIQYTDKCNAACPQCDMRLTNTFRRSKLDLDTAKRSIDHAATQGVMALSITGGEPLLYLQDVSDLLKHAKASGIKYTRTGTNGFMLMHSDRPDFEKRVSRICEHLLEAEVYTFWISIDSADLALHEQLRQLPGVVKGIRQALPIFHRHGLYPSVNLGINRYIGGLHSPSGDEDLGLFYDHFRNALKHFYTNVIDLGFTIVNCCYPMSVPPDVPDSLNAVYRASADHRMVQFTGSEKAMLYQALFDTIPEYRSQIRIFSPRAALLALIREHSQETIGFESAACRGGIDYFFVDARDGNAYPCGYRGHENLGKFWDLDLSSHHAGAHCRQCDWECWRDPSELMAPILGLATQPLAWLRRLYKDRAYLNAWREDLRYMRACGYFNALRPPRPEGLRPFQLTPQRTDLRYQGGACISSAR